MKKKLQTAFLYLILVSLIGFSCSKSQNGDWEEGKEVATEVEDPNDDFLLTLTTEYGAMKIILYKETPIHRENFIKLVRQHYYDSLLFHRVINGFMIQGGDPDSRFADENENLGRGEIGDLLPAEINYKYFHQKGALAMARKGGPSNPDKKSSGCQFYIVDGKKYTKESLYDSKTDYKRVNQYFSSLIEDPEYSRINQAYVQLGERGDVAGQKRLMKKCIPMMEKKYEVQLIEKPTRKERIAYTKYGGAPFLDREYTVFGQVVEGLEVIDKIAAQKVNPQNRPVEDIKMSITVEEVPSVYVEQLLKKIH
ncbi:peptidylprolyl isomerase [Flammeovirga sp. EKP202]|uniref:peptidylprolyl isomerase n=1 Tax=Flammeovirga sp. EKP202 TaxID=2770592 RepID=UPI00165F3D54|nr:peptidylprolyl isomerase [Flammeovirga sp. EKP202]MBD0402443.1 peptidylprolyl isomerase [Flammeovirga sp. EKP202]